MLFSDLLKYHQKQLRVVLKDGSVVEGQILSQRWKNEDDYSLGFKRELLNVTLYREKERVVVECADIQEISVLY